MKNNRRNFLKNLLTGSAGVMIGNKASFANESLKTKTDDKQESKNTADCIVIGAGISGLVAARDLSFPKGEFTGYKTIILEASHRIGGRILSLDLPAFGGPIEMGAEYIHRDEDPRISIWEDINDYDSEMLKFPRMLHGLMFFEGWEDNLEPHFTMVSKWNIIDAFQFSDKIDRYLSGKNISAKEWIKSQNYQNPFGRNLVDFYFTGHMPGPLGQLSVKGFAKDKISEQLKEWNEYGFSKGFTAFLDKLKKGIGNHKDKELDIRYNSPVKLIKYNDQGVEITTRDNVVYKAKTAIITVSIGMLKSGEIEFQPPLPKVKQQALSWIEVGDRAKVILKFKKKFWPDNAVFLNRVDEGREMARTYFVPHANNPEKNNVISVLFAGPEADKIKSMSDQEVLAALVRDFDRMYPKFAKEHADGTIMNLIEGIETNNPTMLRWQWSYDQFAKGSVSYLRSGSEDNTLPVTEARQTLADPRTTPSLFWAGEATAFGPATLHTTENVIVRGIEKLIADGKSTQPSCTHGAHHTGKRAALEVAYFLKNKGQFFKF